MFNDYGINVVPSKADPVDQRIALMQEYVRLEVQLKSAEEMAKEAAHNAAETSAALARVRAELFDVLGVSEDRRGDTIKNERASWT